ncbi:MAG: hypothetical protein PHT84_01650 [Candidatus Pacebacteria bacterium]|nr:hypothetical protein [Candidatus Paceibacterota bacterium]
MLSTETKSCKENNILLQILNYNNNLFYIINMSYLDEELDGVVDEEEEDEDEEFLDDSPLDDDFLDDEEDGVPEGFDGDDDLEE